MKKLSILFMMFLSFVLLAACGNDASSADKGSKAAGEGEQSEFPEKLRLAVTGIEGLEQLQVEFEPFRKSLEEVLDIEVEFFALSNRATAITALEYDQVDIVMSGGTEYVMMRAADENTNPIAALTRPGYLPLIIAHAGANRND